MCRSKGEKGNLLTIPTPLFLKSFTLSMCPHRIAWTQVPATETFFFLSFFDFDPPPPLSIVVSLCNPPSRQRSLSWRLMRRFREREKEVERVVEKEGVGKERKKQVDRGREGGKEAEGSRRKKSRFKTDVERREWVVSRGESRGKGKKGVCCAVLVK